MAELGKVVDTNPEGRAGEAEIVVPKRWLQDRATVEVTLPSRLRCHRCGGGGCDECERRGAYRLPDDDARRRFELPLPPQPGLLRLHDPVDAGTPELVMLTVRIGEAKNVRRLTPDRGGVPWWWLAAIAAAAGAAAYVGW